MNELPVGGLRAVKRLLYELLVGLAHASLNEVDVTRVSSDTISLPTREQKAAWVRSMFDRLAPRYDLFNDLLSAGVHRRWRRHALAALAPEPTSLHLDLCAGTLDLSRAIGAAGARAAAVDFALAMLEHGREKLARDAPAARVWPVAADVLALPFPDATFAGCIVGFGLRNLVDPMAGLIETRRVLAPGGRLVILEFTTPPGRWFRTVYHGYFHHVLPRVGALVAGERAGPRYLPASVAGFPDAPSLGALMAEAGFTRIRWRLLTHGIAALHVGAVE